MKTLLAHTKEINEQLARYGVKFGIYKDGTFNERLFPFDPVPRQIPEKDYKVLEKGLIQRVTALNRFIYDIYHDKKIVRDGVVPEEFVYRSPGYLAQCEGITPSKEVYSHISGIDLVEGKDDEWYILEDNLRIPSGASYPLIARTLCRRCSPETFKRYHAMLHTLNTPIWRNRQGRCWRKAMTCLWRTRLCIIVPAGTR